jgi:hypothetical protein
MRSKAVWTGLAVMSLMLGIFLVGCATAPSGGASKSQADLLKDAGFKAHTGQGAQVKYIQTLPAKKVVLNQYQGKPLYLVCTDPDSKQCFLGDKAAYDRYQQMAIQQSLSGDQHNVSETRWDPEAWQMWQDSQGGG